MPPFPSRNYVLIGALVFIIVFPILVKISSNSPTAKSQSASVSKSKAVKPLTRLEIGNSSAEHQYIVFKNESALVRLYLDVVRDTVCGLTLRTQEQSVETEIDAKKRPFNLEQRIAGKDWPLIGITMIGQRRLVNLEWALRFVIGNGIPGDFIECGVWRGGGSVFARAILKAFDITDRHIWVADSFQGLPKARTSNDNDHWEKQEYLKVSLEEVQTNFRSFNLLDEQVHFCKGYFVDSLPVCGVTQIAVLRMDGDMYESTMDQLFNLYDKVPVGGVIIVDDYNVPECNKAMNDFRSWHNMKEDLKDIPGDQAGVYWIKKNKITLQMDRYKTLLSSAKSP